MVILDIIERKILRLTFDYLEMGLLTCRSKSEISSRLTAIAL